MKQFRIPGRHQITAVALLTFFGVSAPAFAESPVKLQGGGAIQYTPGGLSSFILSGTASHLGRYTCYGEVVFLPGRDRGSLDGVGVAAFMAANGDFLVGVVTWQVDARGASECHFSWRDSVEFSDGTMISSTGRFATSRPPGAVSQIQFPKPLSLLVVIAIIAILIG
jgi:hypothetical protein